MKNLSNRKKLLFLLLIISIVIGAFCLLFSNQQEKKQYDYSKYMIEIKSDHDSELPDYFLSLELLQATNPDVIGILEFDDRMIYEPIVQAPDNDYYVRRNIDGNYASAGIPFIGAEGNIFSTNVVIYGHSSTKSNIIFTPLVNYKNYEFFVEHPTFNFYTMDESRTYQIVAVFEYNTEDMDDSAEFTQFEWRKLSDYALFLNYIKANSIYPTGVNVNLEDKLMTLVTCDIDNLNKRVVIIGKLVQPYE